MNDELRCVRRGRVNNRKLLFFEWRERAGEDTIALAEDEVSGENVSELLDTRRIQVVANDDLAGRGPAGAAIRADGRDDDLIEAVAIDPPIESGLAGVVG